MAIEEIVAGLQEQGLEPMAIQQALNEMLEKGEITQEDYDKALAMIAGAGNPEGCPEGHCESEEEKEERIFGKI